MKLIPFAPVCLALLLAGCESGVSDDVREALGPRESPRTRVFQADQKAVYAAARHAVDEMEFRFVRGGPAEGKLEAMSPVTAGDDPGSSRQISMKVSMEPAADSGTTVEISLTEVLEEDSSNQPGMATQTPLRDTPLYQVFFKDIEAALEAPARE
jgi:hypothetical protein